MMLGHKAHGMLPASLLALLAVLPVGSAWSIFGSRQAKPKPLNQVLASEKSLSTYYDLVKVSLELLGNL